jgi:hypothetical protein
MEFFIAWYAAIYERFAFWNAFLTLLVAGGSACCSATWFRRSLFGSAGAATTFTSFISSACASTLAWFERFIIIVGGLHRDFIRRRGAVYPHLGGYLDPSARSNLHFTLPALRSVSADDRNVGSENCRAGADVHYATPPEFNLYRLAERGNIDADSAGHKVYAMAAEFPSAAALYEAHASATQDSDAGMFFRHSPSTE